MALWGKKKVKNEIERRFLIKQLPGNIQECKKVSIIQGYLNDKRMTRYRKEVHAGNIAYMKAWKVGTGIERLEYEQEIGPVAFKKRWKEISCSLAKTRYLMPYGECVIEVNIFLGVLYEYIHAEVEFPSRQAADAFVAPEWFDCEVTDDEQHGNYWLAKYGKPKEAA
jgi:CYTH domain-containing protein